MCSLSRVSFCITNHTFDPILLKAFRIHKVRALAVAVGDATPLHDLVYSIPPFSSLRGPCKFLVTTQFALVWLAAGGLQSLLDLEGRRRRWTLAALALALCALLEYGIQFSLNVANHSHHLGHHLL